MQTMTTPDAPAQEQPETMTLYEVTAVLRMERHHVALMIRQGKIPGRKVGKNYRIPRARFYQWLAGEEHTPTL